MFRIFRSDDVLTGLMFIGFGLIAIVGSSNYSFGTTANIGPGFFPTMVGSVLACLGVVIGGRALLMRGKREHLPAFRLRPFLVIVGALSFTILLPLAGLFVATAVMFLFGALACKDSKVKEIAILYVILMAIVVFGLIRGLGLQIPLWSS